MDKISFIIPNKKTKDNFNVLPSIDNINKENTNNIVEKKNNYTNEYVKIAPNVYRFNSENITPFDDDIYSLYKYACQEKNANKYNSLEIFKKCKKLINNDVRDEIKYEIYINLALLVSDNDGSIEEINSYYQEALKIYSDRAEPYYYWAMYCNKVGNFEQSYNLLKKALLISYDDVKNKYPSTQITSYGKYLLDELAVSCYWLKKYEEAKQILEDIINDPDFSQHKERLEQNLKYTKEAMVNI